MRWSELYEPASPKAERLNRKWPSTEPHSARHDRIGGRRHKVPAEVAGAHAGDQVGAGREQREPGSLKVQIPAPAVLVGESISVAGGTLLLDDGTGSGRVAAC
jgi:hypothetical protein